MYNLGQIILGAVIGVIITQIVINFYKARQIKKNSDEHDDDWWDSFYGNGG